MRGSDLKHGYDQLRSFFDEFDIPLVFVNESLQLIKINKPYQQHVGKRDSDILGSMIFNTLPVLSEIPEDVVSFLTDKSAKNFEKHVQDTKFNFYHLKFKKFFGANNKTLIAIFISQTQFEEDFIQEYLFSNKQSKLQKSLNAIFTSDTDSILQTAVDQAVELTRSRVGYIHLYNEQEQTIALNVWSQDVHMMCEAAEDGHYPLASAGIWADCVRNRAPVIHNDYATATGKKGLPEGHFFVESHMSVPVIINDTIVAIVGVGNRAEPYTDNDAKVLLIFASVMWYAMELPKMENKVAKQADILKLQQNQLSKSMFMLVGAISETLELKDAFTAGHQRAVSELAAKIAEKLGLNDNEIEGIKLGALIHDIGKMGIPTEILSKPAKLSSVEFELIKTHSQLGADLLAGITFPWPIQKMVLQHHERIDGSGYPNGLKGEQIIKEARIIAVADVCDGITSHRPYRPSLGLHTLLEELKEGRGRIYDADVVDACLAILKNDFVELRNKVGDLTLDRCCVVDIETALEQVIAQLASCKCKYAVVMDEDNVFGCIDDIIIQHWTSPFLGTVAERQIDKKVLKRKAYQVMQRNVRSIPWNYSIDKATEEMVKNDQQYAVVLGKDQQPIGVLNWRSLAIIMPQLKHATQIQH